MVMESMNGKMDKFIRVNGLMELKVDPVSGEVQREIHTLESGKTVRQMGTEYIHGLTETDMKENSRSV